MNTPETYVKPANLASLGSRLAAQLIDCLVIVLILFLVQQVVFFLPRIGAYNQLLAFALAVAYYLFSDSLPNGQSLGKRLLGIVVVDERSYLNCNPLQSFLRNITTPFLSFLDWIFIFFGSRKRLGDMLANTVVLKEKRSARP